MQPEVLLLDEPTAGLSPEAADRLTQVLGNLQLSHIVVSHDEPFLDRTTSMRYRLHDGVLRPRDACR
jgi:cobalt/nickel transport system ATP-binding protein